MGCPELPIEYYQPLEVKTSYKRIFHTVSHAPMGNRASAVLCPPGGGGPVPYSYQANELNQYTEIYQPDGSASTSQYDANGNTLSSPSSPSSQLQLCWNNENRLATTTTAAEGGIMPADAICLESLCAGPGRRRVKKVYSWNTTSNSTTHYPAYDTNGTATYFFSSVSHLSYCNQLSLFRSFL